MDSTDQRILEGRIGHANACALAACRNSDEATVADALEAICQTAGLRYFSFPAPAPTEAQIVAILSEWGMSPEGITQVVCAPLLHAEHYGASSRLPEVRQALAQLREPGTADALRAALLDAGVTTEALRGE